MDRFATVSLESLVEIVGEQLDEQVDFISGKVTGSDSIDGKAAFGFFDIVLHAATLVVKAPKVDRLPLEIGDDRFVMPVRIEEKPSLIAVKHLRFTNHHNAARFLP